MNANRFENLSAFADYEEVDLEALLRELDTPGALEFLRTLIQCRLATRREGRALPADRAEALFAQVERSARRRRRWPAALAAAGLIAGTGFGIWLGRSALAEPKPPVAVREIHFTPGVDWHGAGATPEEESR